MTFKTVDTSTLSLRTARVAGKYNDIIDACKGLKVGQSLQIETPADEKKGSAGYRNKLSYKIRNVNTPSGTFLKVRATADGKSVAVSLVSGSRPARPNNFKPKTEAEKAAAKKAREAKKALAGAKK